MFSFTHLSELNCLTVNLEDAQGVSLVARALSVPRRVEILRLLGEKNVLSVNEIAKALDMPISSASIHVGILEEAGLITCERISSIHGTMKMCNSKISDVFFHLGTAMPQKKMLFNQMLPIGAYARAQGIVAPCGMASPQAPVGAYNRPHCFYLPQRLDAQVLWFKEGTLHYCFSPLAGSNYSVDYMEISFEACTQAQLSQPYKQTPLEVRVNDVLVGVAQLTGETQTRRGTFNPAWWPDISTQYGEFFIFRITQEGSFLRDKKVSDATVAALMAAQGESIVVSLSVAKGASGEVGATLFGSGFGNHNQALYLSMGYRRK